MELSSDSEPMPLSQPISEWDDAPAPVANSTPHESADRMDLDRRLARLEKAVAELPGQLAELLVMGPSAPPPPAPPAPPPVATAPVPEKEVPVAEVLVPKAMYAPAAPAVTPEPRRGWTNPVDSLQQTWLLWEMVRDAGRMLWMFFDRRYRMTWYNRLLVVGLTIVIVASSWWNPLAYLLALIPIPGLERVVGNFVVMILSFFLYKVLSRELIRYTAFLQRGGT